MEGLVNKITEFIKNFNWNGPEAFALVAVVFFLITKRWILIILVLVTVIIGMNIDKYIVLGLEFHGTAISASLIIYIVGAVVITFMAFLSLFNR